MTQKWNKERDASQALAECIRWHREHACTWEERFMHQKWGNEDAEERWTELNKLLYNFSQRFPVPK